MLSDFGGMRLIELYPAEKSDGIEDILKNIEQGKNRTEVTFDYIGRISKKINEAQERKTTAIEK